MFKSLPLERRTKYAAFASLAPILFGIAFAYYAFQVGSVTTTQLSPQGEMLLNETIVESGGAAGVFLALAPLLTGAFVALLLYLARKDADTAPLWMAWAFSGFVALVSVIGIVTLGPFMVVPAVLMLLATGLSHSVVSGMRRNGSR
ncbi:MAG: hypothetical protein JHC98_01550 [Thermoleophilaceae bacterium]|nr:hypothetical protein [Thermoleophilaceae bacterium]